MVASVRGYLSKRFYGLSGQRFSRAFNLLNALYWKSSIVLLWDESKRKIVVQEHGYSLYIARPSRTRRYRRGLLLQLDALADEYMLNQVPISDGDVVIDCGANVGEVGFWLQRRVAKLQIISVEPERSEADCCDLNVYGGHSTTIRKALWQEDGELTFYSKNDTGDSSLFETVEFKTSSNVQTITLESLMREYGLGKVKLLKLEAEGAEPEILLGAGDALKQVEYISADLGPERGLSQETTAATVINFLLARDFRLVDVFAERLVFLFKNQGFD